MFEHLFTLPHQECATLISHSHQSEAASYPYA